MPRVSGTPASATEARIAWSDDLGDYVTAVGWAADGALVAASSLSGRAVVLGADGALVAELPEHPMGALALDWSPRAQRVAFAGQDGVLRIWEPGPAPAVAWEQPAWISTVAWAPNGTRLAAGAGRTLGVFEPDGTPVREYPDLPSTVADLAWSGDSRRVGAAVYGGPLWFEPARTADDAAAHFAWTGSLLTLTVAPSGKWCASGNQDRSVHVWRLWSGDDLQMSGYPTKISALAWSPSSRFLAVGSFDDVTLWDFAGRGPRGTTPRALTGFEGAATGLAYSTDGTHLAATTDDGLRVWAVERGGGTPAVAVEIGEPLSTLAWRPGCHELLVGSATGRIIRVCLS